MKCSNLGLLRLNHPFQDLRQVPCPFSSPAIIHRLSCQATVLPFQVSDPSVPCSLPIGRIPSISLLNALCTGSDLPLLLVHCAGEIVLSNIDPSRANFSFSLTELIRRPTATDVSINCESPTFAGSDCRHANLPKMHTDNLDTFPGTFSTLTCVTISNGKSS